MAFLEMLGPVTPAMLNRSYRAQTHAVEDTTTDLMCPLQVMAIGEDIPGSGGDSPEITPGIDVEINPSRRRVALVQRESCTAIKDTVPAVDAQTEGDSLNLCSILSHVNLLLTRTISTAITYFLI